MNREEQRKRSLQLIRIKLDLIRHEASCDLIKRGASAFGAISAIHNLNLISDSEKERLFDLTENAARCRARELHEAQEATHAA